MVIMDRKKAKSLLLFFYKGPKIFLCAINILIDILLYLCKHDLLPFFPNLFILAIFLSGGYSFVIKKYSKKIYPFLDGMTEK